MHWIPDRPVWFEFWRNRGTALFCRMCNTLLSLTALVPKELAKFWRYTVTLNFAYCVGQISTITDDLHKILSSYTTTQHIRLAQLNTPLNTRTNKMSFHGPESDGTVQRSCQENFTIPNIYWLNTAKQKKNSISNVNDYTRSLPEKQEQQAWHYLVILCTWARQKNKPEKKTSHFMEVFVFVAKHYFDARLS